MKLSELKSCQGMMLIMTISKTARPCRVVDRAFLSSFVVVVGYLPDARAWAKFKTRPENLRIPAASDATICAAAHKSLVWTYEDASRAPVRVGASVVRTELDAVAACGPDDLSDGVAVGRSTRRGMVQVAWWPVEKI